MTRCPSQDWRQEDPPISDFSEALTAFLESWSIPQDLADQIVIHADGIEAEAGGFAPTSDVGELRSNGAGEDTLRRAAEKFDDDVSQPRNLAVEIVDGIRGYTCEVAPSQREHEYWYDRLESLAARAALSTQGDGEMERLRAALSVGERFLSACYSAWAAGEPSHRVKTMVDLADDFGAAIQRKTGGGQ